MHVQGRKDSGKEGKTIGLGSGVCKAETEKSLAAEEEEWGKEKMSDERPIEVMPKR